MNTRILCVDDDAQFLKVLKHHLQSDGYDATTVSDSNEAIQLIAEGKYDLLCLDLDMPIRSGYTLCEYIFRDTDLNCPMVILTGHDDQETVIRCMALGIPHVVKQLNFWEQLKPVLATQLELKQITTAAWKS